VRGTCRAAAIRRSVAGRRARVTFVGRRGNRRGESKSRGNARRLRKTIVRPYHEGRTAECRVVPLDVPITDARN